MSSFHQNSVDQSRVVVVVASTGRLWARAMAADRELNQISTFNLTTLTISVIPVRGVLVTRLDGRAATGSANRRDG